MVVYSYDYIFVLLGERGMNVTTLRRSSVIGRSNDQAAITFNGPTYSNVDCVHVQQLLECLYTLHLTVERTARFTRQLRVYVHMNVHVEIRTSSWVQ